MFVRAQSRAWNSLQSAHFVRPGIRAYAKKAVEATSAPTTSQPSAPVSTSSSTSKSASICLEGTVLEGVAYLKDQKPVLAMADDAYPPWLWMLLKPKNPPGSKPKEAASGKGQLGDATAQKALRTANRKNIRNSNFMKSQ